MGHDLFLTNCELYNKRFYEEGREGLATNTCTKILLKHLKQNRNTPNTI